MSSTPPAARRGQLERLTDALEAALGEAQSTVQDIERELSRSTLPKERREALWRRKRRLVGLHTQLELLAGAARRMLDTGD